MIKSFDFIIVGGGIVGLATAFKIKRKYPDASLALFEKERGVSRHQTGHNSGVIHCGLYYKPGSLKARLSRSGREQLIRFCEEYRLPYEICGKIVAAVDDEENKRLDTLLERGKQNGLKGLEILDPRQISEREPSIQAQRAILVPEEGICDYVAVCEQLLKLLQSFKNTQVFLGVEVYKSLSRGSSQVLQTSAGDYAAKYSIVCGGIQSDRLAKSAGLSVSSQIVPFRGEYYSFKKEYQHLIRHLVYPVPDPNFPFLGVHFTRMMKGGVECGPNAILAFHREDYENPLSLNIEDAIETLSFRGFWNLASKHWKAGLSEFHRSLSKSAFTKALSRLMPSIQEGWIDYHGSGIRAQLLKPSGEMVDDFEFVTGENQLHVLNAPSPAATASLAIADEILLKAETLFRF